MKKQPLIVLAITALIATMSIGGTGCAPEKETPLGMAVEFNAHAACSMISREMGWYEQEGLNVTTYESYVTGMALAAALARGDIQVAYICLVPAINAYANAGVPIKIVAGTHKYGYTLVVNPEKIRTVKDLEKDGIRIGSVREGGATDIFLCRTIDRYNLDREKVLANIRRMNPPEQVLAIQNGQLDAAFLPEQWPALAGEYGFKVMMSSKDVWPGMQGSVLVVKSDLIDNSPELVNKLVKLSQKATDWCNRQPEEAANIMAKQFNTTGEDVLPSDVAKASAGIEMTPDIMLRSMYRLDYTTSIDRADVQETIDYLAELGYIQGSFDARDILDLRFLGNE
jgi:NitT/TauT family transport system substrate-binding protein